jgi:hypothetical protein
MERKMFFVIIEACGRKIVEAYETIAAAKKAIEAATACGHKAEGYWASAEI